MANNNLTINLEARKDQDGQTFYIGKLKFPGQISCADGVVFLIFTSADGEEQMQIAQMENKEKR